MGIVWTAAGGPGLAPAAAQELERQVKAAFLFRFGGFVEWPDGAFARADSPLVIAVFGADGLADELERMVAGRAVGGRPVQVVRLGGARRVPGNTAHIAFIGGPGAAAQGVLDGCRALPVLTVSDQVNGMGCVINFVVVDERVRFEVSLKAAAAAKLRISARLLAAAYRVQPGAA